jgi:hypothetical protein
MATHAGEGFRVRQKASHGKRMSTHIAYALVVYTLLLIFEVSPQMVSKDMSILPYFVLVALVAAVIVPCRNFERRWQHIDAAGDSESHNGQFTREMIGLWLCAIGLPTLLMAIIWIIP